ncbi:hypothetical protein INR49_032030 [Caranx melampygus]|nr:hypothetical protein INR49_032030 [Caranx melampygus]
MNRRVTSAETRVNTHRAPNPVLRVLPYPVCPTSFVSEAHLAAADGNQTSVLSEAVVDWGSMGPGEEWVNSATTEGEQGLSQGTFFHSGEENSHEEESIPGLQNGENLTEWGKTSSTGGEDQWGQTSMSHSDNWVMSTTWDMQLDSTGFLDSEPLREADEDLVSEVNLNNSIMTEEEREEIQQELAKLQEDIRDAVHSRTENLSSLQHPGHCHHPEVWRHEVQLHRPVLIINSSLTMLSEDSYSLRQSMSMPTMRNSPSFKSFEEKVETTVSTIKTKVGGTSTGGSFEEVLSSAANASSQDTPTNNLTDDPERPC